MSKVRVFKNVGGKCNTCADLSEARRRENSMAGRENITALHGFHRTMYMGERQTYYARRQQAISDPKNYFSTISDGMAQAHNELPHRANLQQFKHKLPCHLQGKYCGCL
jgi:hypothetical protein